MTVVNALLFFNVNQLVRCIQHIGVIASWWSLWRVACNQVTTVTLLTPRHSEPPIPYTTSWGGNPLAMEIKEKERNDRDLAVVVVPDKWKKWCAISSFLFSSFQHKRLFEKKKNPTDSFFFPFSFSLVNSFRMHFILLIHFFLVYVTWSTSIAFTRPKGTGSNGADQISLFYLYTYSNSPNENVP